MRSSSGAWRLRQRPDVPLDAVVERDPQAIPVQRLDAGARSIRAESSQMVRLASPQLREMDLIGVLSNPRSTGVIGPPGREIGGSSGQWSAAEGGSEPAASDATAGLGGQCSGPDLGWSRGADAGSGDPRSGRSDAGGGGGVELHQGCFGFQRLGLLAAIRAGGEGAVRARAAESAEALIGGGWSCHSDRHTLLGLGT